MIQYHKIGVDLQNICRENNDVMILYDTGDLYLRYTYKDVWHIIGQYQKLFEEYNIHAGDTISAILPNSPEAVLCFLAAGCCGVNYAPLSCNISRREWENWANLVKPKLCLQKQNILDFQIEVSSIEINVDGDFSWLPDLEDIEIEINGDGKVFLLTSGTTGEPKAMQININKLWTSGLAFVDYYSLKHSKLRFWNYLPVSYLGGLYNLSLIPIALHGSFVITEPFSGKTMLNYWNVVDSFKITAIWLVPSIIQGLLTMSNLTGEVGEQLSKNIKVCFLGTAPINKNEKDLFEKTFSLHVYENFALSETTFITAENDLNIKYREQGSVGEVLPYVDMKIKKVDGCERIGSIWIKTPYLFDGYLGEDGNLILDLDDEGYFNTKDLAFFNDFDVLVLAGRTRDIIKKGGLFVSLIEVENIVVNLDFVKDVAAIPIKHDFYGEVYVLAVVFVDENKDRCDHLKSWLIDNIVQYKLPEKIISMKEFPRTASGKIQKKEIEKLL